MVSRMKEPIKYVQVRGQRSVSSKVISSTQAHEVNRRVALFGTPKTDGDVIHRVK